MKPKHLITLICIAVVLGIIYMAQQGKRKDAAGTAGGRESASSSRRRISGSWSRLTSAATISPPSNSNAAEKPSR